jgi:hypothetical protein
MNKKLLFITIISLLIISIGSDACRVRSWGRVEQPNCVQSWCSDVGLCSLTGDDAYIAGQGCCVWSLGCSLNYFCEAELDAACCVDESTCTAFEGSYLGDSYLCPGCDETNGQFCCEECEYTGWDCPGGTECRFDSSLGMDTYATKIVKGGIGDCGRETNEIGCDDAHLCSNVVAEPKDDSEWDGARCYIAWGAGCSAVTWDINVWDGSHKVCSQCRSDNTQGTTVATGGFPPGYDYGDQDCESACGAHPDCDELPKGADCTEDKPYIGQCSNSCDCIDQDPCNDDSDCNTAYGFECDTSTGSCVKCSSWGVQLTTERSGDGINKCEVGGDSTLPNSCNADLPCDEITPGTGGCTDQCKRCEYYNPTVTLLPVLQTGCDGDTLSYVVTVTNENTLSCADSVYSLTDTCPGSPPGWTCSLSRNSILLSPGESGTAILSVTSPIGAPDNDYTVRSEATDSLSGLSGSDTATYRISCGCSNEPTVNIIPNQQIGCNNDLTYSVIVTNNNPIACPDSDFTLTPTCPLGWPTCSVNPVTLTIPARNSGLSTLTVKSVLGAPEFDYIITVDALDQLGNTGGGVANYQVYCECFNSSPTVTFIPPLRTSSAGVTVGFTVNVTNENTQFCLNRIFDLTESCPSGWTCSLDQNFLTLSSGESDTVALDVTSSASASKGFYTAAVTAEDTDSGETGSGQGTIEITEICNCSAYNNCACDSVCPPGCTWDDDKDCGCANDGEDCCGIGCNNDNDRDCGLECSSVNDCIPYIDSRCTVANQVCYPGDLCTGICPGALSCYFIERTERWFCNSLFDPDICTCGFMIIPCQYIPKTVSCAASTECRRQTCSFADDGLEMICSPIFTNPVDGLVYYSWSAVRPDGTPWLTETGSDFGLNCIDTHDNDCDGCIDGDDIDCGGFETDCNDGIDNDCDRNTDYADDDCCTLISSDLSTICSGGTSADCEQGEAIDMSLEYLGDCSKITNPQIQINARSLDGTCGVRYSGAEVSGLTGGSPSFNVGCESGHVDNGDGTCTVVIYAEPITGYMEKNDIRFQPRTNTEKKYLGAFDVFVGTNRIVGGGWISPTSATTEDDCGSGDDRDCWRSRGSAIDNNLSSFAYNSYTENARLSLRQPQAIYDKVRIYSSNTAGGEMSARIHFGFYSFVANELYNGNIPAMQWFELDIPTPRYESYSYVRASSARIYEFQSHGMYNYSQMRGYLSFDASSIPSIADIISTELSLAIKNDQSISRDFDITLYRGFDSWTGESDLNWSDASVNEGIFLDTFGKATNLYYNFPLPTSSISFTGKTQFRLTSSIETTRPNGQEYVSFYGQNSATFKPKITITYRPNRGTLDDRWFVPSVPAECEGKTIYANSAAIWDGVPYSGILKHSIIDVNPQDSSPVDGSFRLVSSVPPQYLLTVDTMTDVTNAILSGVDITVGGVTKTTDASGIVRFNITQGNILITAESPFGTRPFSHFWDHDANVDCTQDDPLDISSNPYSFNTNNCDRDITTWYKAFTYFENSGGTQDEIDYDGAKISGYLFREDDNPLHYDGIVNLYYFDGIWVFIGSTTVSRVNGYFEYDWPCFPPATRIRASFAPSSWYYVSSSGEMAIDCSATCDGYDDAYPDITHNPPCIGQCSGYDYSSYSDSNQIRDYSLGGSCCDCSVAYDSYITSVCGLGVCSGDNAFDSTDNIEVTTTVRNTGTLGQGWWKVETEFWYVDDYNNPTATRHSPVYAWYNNTDGSSGCSIPGCDCTSVGGILTVGGSKTVTCYVPASYFGPTTGNERVMYWMYEADVGQDAGGDGNGGYSGLSDAFTKRQPASLRTDITTCVGPDREPHINGSYFCEEYIIVDEEMTCFQTYTHDMDTAGGIHFSWLSSKAEYVDVVGPNCYDLCLDANGAACTCGNTGCYYVVECVPIPADINVTLTIKPNETGKLYINHRAWDTTQDRDCGGGSSCDYDRDPSSGECSSNCNLFPDDAIRCNHYITTTNVLPLGSSKVNFSGYLEYNNETVLAFAKIIATITYKSEEYSTVNMTDSNGYFFIEIPIPSYLISEDFLVTFYVRNEIEAIYECIYDHRTEECIAQ